jgi:YidC/Oxa1 family membrane protein insertase
MRKLFQNKKVRLVVVLLLMLAFLTACQNNVDSSGNTLPERIIYLTTTWSEIRNESIFSAIFVWPLALSINWLTLKLGSVTVAVILTALALNLLTFGLSVKSTVSSQRLQMLQPEMTKIQAKYEGRTDENAKLMMAQEMQGLYSKYKINPLSSMIVPFLSLPIMIAMYYAVQRAEAVVNGTILGVRLAETPWHGFSHLSGEWILVLIWVLMVVFQFLSTQLPQYLAKKKKKQKKNYKAYVDEPKSGQQMQTNIMMYGMVVLIGYLGIRFPTAMSLYWLTSSIITVIKTLFIQWRYIDRETV